MLDDMITIPLEEYEALRSSAKFLACLTACGVDNWDGFDYAQEMMEEDG